MLLSGSAWYLVPRWDLSSFGARGPSTVALDVVLPRGMLSTGSGEGSHHLGLGECSGTGTGGAAEADGCLEGEAPCEKENGWDVGVCPLNM